MDPFNKSHFYLIELQYLGFRYHGWAKQPDVKTVQGMVNKTLRYVLEGIPFKTLGSSRTDAMVSVNSTTFELFTKQEIDTDWLLEIFNKNLPQDIKAISIIETDENFNIIQSAKQKEYLYLFSFGTKNHPFSSPFMTSVQDHLDIEVMKKGAISFKGEHNFKQYSYKPSETTN
ncbi:MAG: tRNA pseudouridine(38-40) synthase TruA, partial [Cyclobacteriaceae bacterium]|nr:tRNA pseudouridine(38-40) synthase TruA [Cyclobacteriaceae bacterium]